MENLVEFIDAKPYYKKFESYRNIKGIILDLNDIEQNIDEIVRQIARERMQI